MINKLHERCLQKNYCKKSRSYGEFLKKDGSVLLHQEILCILAEGHFERVCVCVCVVCVCEGGVTTPLPPSFLKFVGILIKCVGKTSRLNVVGKFLVKQPLSGPTETKLLPAMTAFKEAI